MNTQQFERRRMLRGAVVLGTGVVAGLAPRAAQARERDDTNGIEGTWLILVRPGGAPQSAAYEVLNLYTVGGGVAGASAHDPATGSSALRRMEENGKSPVPDHLRGVHVRPSHRTDDGPLKGPGPRYPQRGCRDTQRAWPFKRHMHRRRAAVPCTGLL